MRGSPSHRHEVAGTAERDLTHLLHERGQRATPQRLVILRELRRCGRHCTAEEIRRSVGEELPGTSGPTVYATLELLVDLGLARRLQAGGGATLYDPRIEPHHHMLCRVCGRIDDLDHPVDAEPILRAATDGGFAGDDVEIVVSGQCAECVAAARTPAEDAGPTVSLARFGGLGR